MQEGAMDSSALCLHAPAATTAKKTGGPKAARLSVAVPMDRYV
jgi:hypothetical protein